MRNSKTPQHLLLWFALLLLASFACSLPDGESDAARTESAATVIMEITQTALANTIIQPEQTSSPVPAPDEPTPIPSITPTPTSSIPMVTVSSLTNCRSGPGIAYALLGGLQVGETAEVVGVAPSGWDYVIINNPDAAGTCWLWLQYATITGSLAGLPVYPVPDPPPPTATPTESLPNWNGVWSFYLDAVGFEVVANVSQSGTTITGSMPFSGDTMNFNGSIVNAEGTRVVGTYSINAGPAQGEFVWVWVEASGNQFSGHWLTIGDGGDFCGYRDGAGLPVPCYAP